MDPAAIAANIRRYRVGADLTQAAAATRIGVHRQTWNRWENAELIPSVTKLGEIADALGVQAVDLLAPEVAA